MIYLYELPRMLKIIDMESRIVFRRGWGKTVESYCLMGTEFQFGMKKLVVVVTQQW